MPFARCCSGWAKGSQSLKSPTTDTAPPGSSTGSAKVTRTLPLRPGLAVLINCSLRSGAEHPDRAIVPNLRALSRILRCRGRRVVVDGDVINGRRKMTRSRLRRAAVEVEVAAVCRRPREAPGHALLVRGQLLDRGA